MVKKQTIKRDKTLIESLIEDSKQLIDVKNVIAIARELLFRVSKCKYKPIDSKQDALKSIIFEYKNRADELESHMANMFKIGYSHQYEIKENRFHISTPEMQAGHMSVTIHKQGKTRKAILFFADVTPDFLDTIKAGEIREYTEELESLYLSHCPSVWNPNSFLEMHFERLKSIMK